jgi:1-acyl-sn-glycerol-3-phosphate acyltransferase
MHRATRVWHRFALRGAERIPRGPCLFVGNHSGIGVSDVLCLLGASVARFGVSRRIVGMMHKTFIEAPIVGWFTRSFGAVYASRESAREAIARGEDVACFPGGDIDSSRPFYEHRDVDFGERRGYVRLALETGVPIVPVATIGSHYSYLLLPGGFTVSRLFGLKRRLRVERVPIPLFVVALVLFDALAIAGVVPWWAVAIATVLAILPSPVRVTSEVLPPIDVSARTAHIDDIEARVEAAHAMVHGALKDAVQRMRHDAPLVLRDAQDPPGGEGAPVSAAA